MATAIVLKSQLLFPKLCKSDKGDMFAIRYIQTADFQRLKRFVENLSFTSRYHRFGNGNFQPDEITLRKVCNPDTDVCAHMVITINKYGVQEIVASGRYVIQADTSNAEFAMVISDAYQNYGLGHHLLESLEMDAKNRGVKKMHGQILSTNTNMLNFTMRCGYTIQYHPEVEYLKLAIKVL